jgi:hypothetical protein
MDGSPTVRPLRTQHARRERLGPLLSRAVIDGRSPGVVRAWDMSALSRQPEVILLAQDWQADVTQLLDENHLAAWSDTPQRRTQFAVSLAQFLGTQRDTEVCVFYGKHINDLDSFCYQLERAIPGPSLDRRIDGPGGVVALLRTRASFRGRPESKFRYYIWHDADVLLRANHNLFGQLVDALAGVAAEAEYVSDDLLLLHRAVFVGGPILDIYAEDPRSQFNAWRQDEHDEPFWRVVTGIEAPPFLRYRIDVLNKR